MLKELMKPRLKSMFGVNKGMKPFVREHEESALLGAEQKLKKYLAMTEKALSLVKVAATNKSSKEYKSAVDFLQMAKDYLSDSKHFHSKGDVLTAIAAASYAHAWLDAGARLGLFKVDSSSGLFTVE